MRKRILSTLLALCMALTLLPGTAWAEDAPTSGSCGDNVTWSYSDGTLTIQGTGPMKDYYSSSSTSAPWQSYAADIHTVNIGSGVTRIGNYAFHSGGSFSYDDKYKYTNLTSVSIPNTVTSIGDSAFFNCSSLTSVSIPDSITSIGKNVFTGCSSLTSVVIPNSVTSIGDYAFDSCSSLTNVTIPNSVTSISNHAFSSCSSLTSIAIPNTVTSIGDYAFQFCTSLTNMTIPTSVTSIGVYAFLNCSSLTSITIPDSVTSIGNYAFENCTSLTSVTIPNSITKIGALDFYNCTSLTNVTIPNSVTSIESGAFMSCTNLTSVTIPNSVTTIGKSAFSKSGLTSVTIPNSVTSIGDSAFSGCSNLTSVTIPNSITSISEATFDGCSKLTSVVIPNSVTSIGSSVFSGCSSLTNVIIPNSVTSIGNSAFWGCNSLTNVTIPNDVTSIENYTFSFCSSLTSVNIPDSVTSIGNQAFRESGLISVTIPNGVTSIGWNAFDGCSNLTSATIPDSVTSIANYAFYGCNSLKDVYYSGSETQWKQIAIGNSNDLLLNATIHYNSTGPGTNAPVTNPTEPDGILDTVQTSNYKVISLRDNSNTAIDFSYAVPTSGATMLIFFRAENCTNSVYVLQSLAKSEWISDSNINIVAVESSGASKETTQNFMDTYVGNRQMYFDTYYGNKSLISAYTRLVNGTSGGTYPFVLLVTEQQARNYIQFSAMGMYDAAYYGNALAALLGTVGYTDTVNVTVAGTQYYDYAYEVYEAVNRERENAGVSRLILNKTLTEYAMQRAAEIALYYDHIRPNGQAYESIYDSSYGNYSSDGENIAFVSGANSAIQVMNGWMASEGHKANILRSSFTQIGVGCFESNGTVYYVQIFGNSTTNTAVSTRQDQVQANVTVSTLTNHLNTRLTTTKSAITLSAGETANLYLVNTNSQSGQDTFLVPIISDVKDEDNPDLTIATTSVSADNQGTITLFAQAAGTGAAYFEAYEGDTNPATILLSVEVSEIDADDVFIKQQTTYTCTLASATMMLRRRAIIDSRSDWKSITEVAVKDVAWDKSAGLKWNFEYLGMHVTFQRIEEAGYNTLAKKQAYLISLLSAHPEGIVVYEINSPHAVLLTDYDSSTQTFYCADPAGSTVGRVPLGDSNVTINKKGQTQAQRINAISRIWCIDKITPLKTLTSSIIASDCPVEMLITINGETLDSRTLTGSSSNAYATMMVRGTGSDRTVKVIVNGPYLEEGTASVQLFGTASGTMTFVVENYFTDGTTEKYAFEDVPVTETTTGVADGLLPQSTIMLKMTDAQEEERATIWTADPDETVYVPATDFDGTDIPDASENSNAPWTNPFTDVSESDWFYNEVAYVVQNGLMQGVGYGEFNPNGTTTRSMIVTILYRLEGEPTVSQSTFTDVAAGQWYTDAVAWAAANGIVEGYGYNTFGPNDEITREQIATILYRYATYKGYDVIGQADLSGYTDVGTISSWALTAMRWANSEGLITGRTSITVAPNGTAIRAEAATILARFCRDVAGME